MGVLGTHQGYSLGLRKTNFGQPLSGGARQAPKMSLSPHRETYWRQSVRNLQILIVSAVKFCKQCLQTVSAPDPYRRFAPGTHWETFVPDHRGYSPFKWKFLQGPPLVMSLSFCHSASFSLVLKLIIVHAYISESCPMAAQAWARGTKPPKVSLSPPAAWKIQIKNQEVNCAKFSIFDCLCAQIMLIMSTDCFSFWGKSSDSIPGLHPSIPLGTYVPHSLGLRSEKSWRRYYNACVLDHKIPQIMWLELENVARLLWRLLCHRRMCIREH